MAIPASLLNAPSDSYKSPTSTLSSQTEDASNEFMWNSDQGNHKGGHNQKDSSISSISEADESDFDEEKDRRMTEVEEEFPPPPPSFLSDSIVTHDANISNVSSPEGNRRLTEVLVPPEKMQAEVVYIHDDDENEEVFESSSSSSSAETVRAREDAAPIIPLNEQKLTSQPPITPAISPAAMTSLRRPSWRDDLKKRMSDARISFMASNIPSPDAPSMNSASPASLDSSPGASKTDVGDHHPSATVPVAPEKPIQRPLSGPPPYRDPPPPPSVSYAEALKVWNHSAIHKFKIEWRTFNLNVHFNVSPSFTTPETEICRACGCEFSAPIGRTSRR